MNSNRFFRSPAYLKIRYYLGIFPLEVFLFILLLQAYCFKERDSRFSWEMLLMSWFIVVVVSALIRLLRRKKETRYFDFRKIEEIDFNASKYADGTGEPCVRVTVSIDSFNHTTLKDQVKLVEFRLYSYLDFENHFQDCNDAIGRILRSIPLYMGSSQISYGDYVSHWAFPPEYRTKWGLVEMVSPPSSKENEN